MAIISAEGRQGGKVEGTSPGSPTAQLSGKLNCNVRFSVTEVSSDLYKLLTQQQLKFNHPQMRMSRISVIKIRICWLLPIKYLFDRNIPYILTF